MDIYRERLLELGKKFEEYRFDAGHGSLAGALGSVTNDTVHLK